VLNEVFVTLAQLI